MFVFPPTNHWANGSSHWSTFWNGSNQCSSPAMRPQKPSRSSAASRQRLLVLRHGADAGLGRKIARRREDPLFFHHVVDLAGTL